MSLREVSSSKPFLAKKGGATPVKLATVRGVPTEPSLRPIESDEEISLDSMSQDTGTSPKTKATGKRSVESAPAASLLPFDLLRKKYRPELSPDLAEDEPDMEPADFVSADLVAIDLAATLEPEPKQQAELTLRVEPKPAAELRAPAEVGSVPKLKIPLPQESEADASLEAPALAPTPDPDWRVGVEAMARPKRASGGGWLLPFGALAAAFAALVVGWNMANPDVDWGFGTLRFGSTSEPVVASDTASDVTVPTSVEPPPPIVESPALVEPATPSVETPVSETPASTVAIEPEPTAPTPPTPLEASIPEPVLSPVDSESSSSGIPTEAEAADLQSAEAPSETQPSETQGTTDQSATAPVQAVPAQAVPAQTASTEQAATTQQTAPPAPAAPVKPTVDVVRLEASGEAVIAGRAAPNSELIVLDNGEPIGTVQADAFGEWVFVPEVALPTGDHEFGLVVKTVQESVNLPAPSRPSLPPAPTLEPALMAPESASESVPATPLDATPDTAPGPDLAPDAASPDTATDVEASSTPEVAPATGIDDSVIRLVPVPLRKPAPAEAGSVPADDQAGLQGTPATKVADFVVQLASVKTRAGAEQEWSKLKQRFPEILSDMVPALDEVKLVDYGTVIRVRTGAFDSQRDAANLCAQLTAKRQACLVVKTSGGN